MCPNHHDVIDRDEATYTVARLLQMKADHEAKAVAPIGNAEATAAARRLVGQAVTSINQSGGITAGVVIIHQANPQPDRREQDRVRARALHDVRVSLIAEGKGPVRLIGDGTMVLHVIPRAALDGEYSVGFGNACNAPDRFTPMGSDWARDSKTFHDGTDSCLVTGSNSGGLGEAQRAYVCVLGTSALEAVVSSLAIGYPKRIFLELQKLQDYLIQCSRYYAHSLRAIGAEPPFFVSLSLVGVSGMRLMRYLLERALPVDMPSNMLSANLIKFGDAVFDAVPVDNSAAANALEPILGRLATAAGLTKPSCFDAAGNYLPKRRVAPQRPLVGGEIVDDFA